MNSFTKLVVVAAFVAPLATAAGAATCNNGPLEGCFVSADGLDRTEAIAKIDFEDLVFTGNKNFPSVSLGDFDFSGIIYDEDDEVAGGIVKYTLGVDDPGMTAFSTKRGGDEKLFFGSDWITFADRVFTFNLGEGRKAVSNFVIYDNYEMSPIPLPAAGWLLLAGLSGLAAMRRRKA